MILTTTYESNPKATAWNDSKKLMSVKTRTIKEVSVVQFYMGFRRYYSKQREISLLYLIAESRILQSCFCQQPY